MKKPFFKHFSLVVALLAIFIVGYTSGLVKGRDVFAQSIQDVDMTEFWKVWEIIQDKYVPSHGGEELTSEILMSGAVKGLVDSLDDPYSVYFNTEENRSFREAIDGNFQGVGMEVGMSEGMLTVVAPLKDTPAERSGILPGDIILEIDGETTVKLAVDEAVAKIRGEVGTEVVLTVFRPSTEEELSISIERAIIKIPVLETDVTEDGIFIITLYNFTGSVDADFAEAMRAFRISRSNKLILDLRGNPGGFLDAAINVSSYFLPKGAIVVKEDFGSTTRSLRSTGKGYDSINPVEVIVLTNGGSASASEIVAGALSQHSVATLVGTKTFGKGSVQELIGINSNTSLKLTIARWLTPDGTSLSENGLIPEYEVVITPEDMENERDTQMEKALELLRN